MKAIRIHQTGGPEVMNLEDVPVPDPAPGEVLVKIGAAGLNFIDTYHRTGLYPMDLPLTLGLEAAGTIEAVGDDVSSFKPGDRVAYASSQGAYAEFAAVPESKLVPVLDGLDFAQAAASMIQGMTAHYLTHSTYAIQPGDTVFVHAAAGGTGALVVQMAKQRGATVLGTVSTAEKAELARKAGADHVIRYTQADFEAEAMRITEGAGVHAVYDSVGKTTFDKSLNILRPRGFLVLFGQSSGKVPPFDPGRLGGGGSLYLTRPSLFAYIASREDLLWRARDVMEAIIAEDVSLRLDRTLPLAEAAEAHRLLENRETAGKVILKP